MCHGTGSLFQRIAGKSHVAAQHKIDELSATGKETVLEGLKAVVVHGIEHDEAKGTAARALAHDKAQAGTVARLVCCTVKGFPAALNATQVVGHNIELVPSGNGAHDRVPEKAFLYAVRCQGNGSTEGAVGRSDQPVLLLVAHPADIEIRLEGADQDLCTQPQSLGWRHKPVRDGQQLMADSEKDICIRLHGRHVGQKSEQASPAVQNGMRGNIRNIARIKSMLRRGKKIDDSPAIFRCSANKKLDDAFSDLGLCLLHCAKTPGDVCAPAKSGPCPLHGHDMYRASDRPRPPLRRKTRQGNGERDARLAQILWPDQPSVPFCS